MFKFFKEIKENQIKEQISKRVMKEFGIEMSDRILDAIIHDEQRLKMFKERGYV